MEFLCLQIRLCMIDFFKVSHKADFLLPVETEMIL